LVNTKLNYLKQKRGQLSRWVKEKGEIQWSDCYLYWNNEGSSNKYRHCRYCMSEFQKKSTVCLYGWNKCYDIVPN